MNRGKKSKGNLYTALVIVSALGVPLISALRGRISEDAMHLLYGILIGLALVFLAAATRKACIS